MTQTEYEETLGGAPGAPVDMEIPEPEPKPKKKKKNESVLEHFRDVITDHYYHRYKIDYNGQIFDSRYNKFRRPSASGYIVLDEDKEPKSYMAKKLVAQAWYAEDPLQWAGSKYAEYIATVREVSDLLITDNARYVYCSDKNIVTRDGRVFSLPHYHRIKPCGKGNKAKTINISTEKGSRILILDRVIYCTFHGTDGINNRTSFRHVDGDPNNFNVDNIVPVKSTEVQEEVPSAAVSKEKVDTRTPEEIGNSINEYKLKYRKLVLKLAVISCEANNISKEDIKDALLNISPEMLDELLS